MNAPKHVLVTGSSGAIGRSVCDELLRRGHRVRGFDRVAMWQPNERVEDAVHGNLEDPFAVAEAMQRVDTVVHLAAIPNNVGFFALLGPNVVGVYNVMEAARREGVKRVILASTIQVVSSQFGKLDRLLRGDDRYPTNDYALAKLWAEELGEMYARCHAMSVIAARIFWVVRGTWDAARMVNARQTHLYLSGRDVGEFFACAVEASNIDFAVLYATGAEGTRLVDAEAARRLIGYEPRDRWPEGFPFELPQLEVTE
ncbi:MAG TPA: NAD(P)-dependent oxidoreductase [Polyangiaceae bacterium]|jgi:nucleoside-diphosphate-sugar epimerase